MSLLLLIGTPLIASLLSLVSKKKKFFLEGIAACAGIIEFVSMIVIGRGVLHYGSVSFSPLFTADPLGFIILFATASVSCIAAFHSIGYLRTEVKKGIIGFQRVGEYFFLFHLFIAAMYIAILSTNPILMWIAIEATTLATTFLISFYNKASAVEAAWKYLVINSLGLLLGFFGTLLTFSSLPREGISQFIDWNILLTHTSITNPFIIKIAFIFVLIGYGTKVGLAPMHTWLPDAHSKAPSPISALLSGALLNVAFLAIIRFKIITDTFVDMRFTENLLISLGFFSIVIAGFIIFVQKKYKRLLAYSSIEHMGVIALGFGFGGVGSFAALLHMIYHSFAKSLLFCTSGNIFLKYGFSKISNIRGMASVMPISAFLFFLGFLALTGVPPFGIFITEVTILASGMAHHSIISLCTLLFLVLIFVGFLRHVVLMIFSEQPDQCEKEEANMFSIAPLVVLLFFFIFLSVYLPNSLQSLIHSAALNIK